MAINRQNLKRTLVAPSLPRNKVGIPKYKEFTNEGISRSYRTAYDWKAYSQKQLVIMEKYWDDFTRVYLNLFPQKSQVSPQEFSGINLGTFNGCFQKAWMRHGFNMYGIEIADVISELHEYGCHGHRGTFFKIPEIETGKYDFALLDRCICGDVFYETFDKPLESQSCVKTKDFLNNNITLPPFFSEIFRILKPGGFLLAVLYQHWSERILKELNTYGKMEIWPIDAWHPWLAVRVVKGEEPEILPDLSSIIKDIEFESSKPSNLSIENIAGIASQNRYIWELVRTSNNRIRFLFLPTNELISASLSEEGRITVEEQSFWDECPWKEAFFEDKLTIVRSGSKHDVSDHFSTAIILSDDPRYKPNKTIGYISEVENYLSKFAKIYRIEGRIKGSKRALATASQIIEEVPAGTVFISLARHDTKLGPRNGREIISYSEHTENMKRLIKTFREKNWRVVLFDAPLMDTVAKGINQDKRVIYENWNKRISEYNKADRELARSLNCEIISLVDDLKSHVARNGYWLSSSGKKVLAGKLASLL